MWKNKIKHYYYNLLGNHGLGGGGGGEQIVTQNKFMTLLIFAKIMLWVEYEPMETQEYFNEEW